MSNLRRDAINRLQMQLPWSPGSSMSTDQVSAILDCSHETVRMMVKTGELVGYPLRRVKGSPLRIYKDSVVAYLNDIHRDLEFDLDKMSRSAKSAKAVRSAGQPNP